MKPLAAILGTVFYDGRSASEVMFNSGLSNTLVPKIGSASYLFVRDSAATVSDHESNVRVTTNNEARFLGSRRVENLLTGNSENLLFQNLSGYNGGTVVGENTVNFSAVATSVIVNMDTLTAGIDVAISMVLWVDSGTHDVRVSLGANSNEVEVTTVPTRFYLLDESTGGTAQWALQNGLAAQAGDVHVSQIQIEDVIGQANLSSSEYVSTGVATGKNLIPPDILQSTDNWTLSANFSIDTVNERLLLSVTATSEQAIYATPSLIEGRLYKVEFDVVDLVTAAAQIFVGGSSAGVILAGTGHHEYIIRAGADKVVLMSVLIANVAGYFENFKLNEADHGSNIDGVKCFSTENWNTGDDTTHVVIDRSDSSPQLRQRLVQNVLTDSGDLVSGIADGLGDSFGTDGGAVIAPDGSLTARRIISGANTATWVARLSRPTIENRLNSWWFRASHNTSFPFFTGNGSVVETLNVSTGWQRIATQAIACLTSDARIGTFAPATSVNWIEIWHPQMEVVDSLADMPSEYVSVGVPTGGVDALADDFSIENGVANNWDYPDAIGLTVVDDAFHVEHQNIVRSYEIQTSVELTDNGQLTPAGQTYEVEFTIDNYVESTPSVSAGISVYLGNTLIAQHDVDALRDGTFLYIGTVASVSSGHGDFYMSVSSSSVPTSLLAFDLKGLSLRRIDHGYFDADDTGVYLDGIKGFDFENGNIVDGGNVVIAGKGAAIMPTDGYLSEEAYTNYCLWSESLSNANWTPSNVSSPVSTGFLSRLPAYLFSNTTSTNVTHEIKDAGGSCDIVNSQDASFSAFFSTTDSEAVYGYLLVWDLASTNGRGMSVHLGTHVVTALIDSSAGLSLVANSERVEVVNGGVRFSFSITNLEATGTRFISVGFSDSPTSRSTAYSLPAQSLGRATGVQFTQGSMVNSYIESEATTLGINADSLSYEDVIIPTVGSLSCVFRARHAEIVGGHLNTNISTANSLLFNISGFLGSRAGTGFGGTLTTTVPYAVGREYKVAIAWDGTIDRMAMAIDGALFTSHSNTFGTYGAPDLFVVDRASYLNIVTYKTSLSNSKLQAMTS